MLPEDDQSGETPEVETNDVVQELEVGGVDLDTEDEPEGEEAAPVADETEEVEHEGKKYKIPKPLKGALLMQADYTRKTQEVAAQRKAHEEAVKDFEARQKLYQEVTTENARVVALNDAIAQYEKVDWATLRASNSKAYDEHWFNYQQTLRQRDNAQKTLDAKIIERTSKANADAQTALDKFRNDVIAAVPEIVKPDHLAKLNDYAVSLGFTPQELAQVRDPRLIKALNAAYVGSQAKVTQAAVAKAVTAQAAKPLATLKGTAGNRAIPTDPSGDSLSADEWARRRNEQKRKQRGR